MLTSDRCTNLVNKLLPPGLYFFNQLLNTQNDDLNLGLTLQLGKITDGSFNQVFLIHYVHIVLN